MRAENGLAFLVILYKYHIFKKELLLLGSFAGDNTALSFLTYRKDDFGLGFENGKGDEKKNE